MSTLLLVMGNSAQIAVQAAILHGENEPLDVIDQTDDSRSHDYLGVTCVKYNYVHVPILLCFLMSLFGGASY